MANLLVSKEITYAPTAFKLLNGLFCVYKPPQKGFAKTQLALRQKITEELNSMECRPVRERIQITGDLRAGIESDSTSTTTSVIDSGLKVELVPNLADHPLVSGPRYSEEHLSLFLLNNPGWYASGLIVGLIGPATGRWRYFHRHRFPKIYEIKGQLGFASDNHRNDGKIRAKTTFKHIKREHYERILAKIEAAQRSQMFRVAGVDVGSEEAYQIASAGKALPATPKSVPLITALRSVSFEPPNFTIQVQCSNEQEMFLAELVNEIGIALHSSAYCTGIRCLKYGPFSIDNALLKKHWTLENIIENIYACKRIVEEHKLLQPIYNQDNEHDNIGNNGPQRY